MKRFYLSRTDNRKRTRLYWRKTIDGSVIGIFNEVIQPRYVCMNRVRDSNTEKNVCDVLVRTVTSVERDDDVVDAWANITFAFMVFANINARNSNGWKICSRRHTIGCCMTLYVVNRRASTLWMKYSQWTEWKRVCAPLFRWSNI